MRNKPSKHDRATLAVAPASQGTVKGVPVPKPVDGPNPGMWMHPQWATAKGQAVVKRYEEKDQTPERKAAPVPNLPRSIPGKDLIKALRRMGYESTRQNGSHVRMTDPGPPEHHQSIPHHAEVQRGTLSFIVSDIAHGRGLTREAVITALFG